ncbi:MAG: protease complex subunit PrcB family protein [Gemmatimonadales bacterium]
MPRRSPHQSLIPVILLLWVAGGCAAPTNHTVVDEVPAGAAPVKAEPIAEVESILSYSGIEEATRMMITKQGEWIAAWEQLFRHTQPAPPVPSVDFAQSAIVVAAMGTRPSGGHAITFEGAYRDDRRLYLVFLERTPGPTCMTTAAITAPVAVVRIARTDLPVAYVEKKETTAC